ncbi:MAG: tetraacyldisaccharide 4'-kinase, partial [Tunicatimonas sp.]
MSRLLSILLFPLSLIYRAATTFRNHLYDIQSRKTIAFTPFIISVGNLSVGGTGKTPMVVYLAQRLKDDYPLAILSRGYGRQTRSVRIANAQDTARTLGDEPYLFYRRFGKQSTVAVGEERVAAVPEILFHTPDTQVILLDDAYQHRAIGRDFNILLTNHARPFYADQVLPAGRLRESRRGAQRADAVVVTKCPNHLPEETRNQI